MAANSVVVEATQTMQAMIYSRSTAAFIAALPAVTLCLAQAVAPIVDRRINSEGKADLLLEAAIKPLVQFGDGPLRYYYNRVDLNGDGKPEVLVYIKGPPECGSGGCSALIFSENGGKYRLVSNIALARTPITVSSHRTNGWSDLIMPVSGGGTGTPYFAVLEFDGSEYPGNPTVAPSVRLKQRTHGVNYISDETVNGSGLLLEPASGKR